MVDLGQIRLMVDMTRFRWKRSLFYFAGSFTFWAFTLLEMFMLATRGPRGGAPLLASLIMMGAGAFMYFKSKYMVPYQEALHLATQSDGLLSVTEVAAKLGIDATTAKATLERFVQEGIAERVQWDALPDTYVFANLALQSPRIRQRMETVQDTLRQRDALSIHSLCGILDANLQEMTVLVRLMRSQGLVTEFISGGEFMLTLCDAPVRPLPPVQHPPVQQPPASEDPPPQTRDQLGDTA